jgi:hypothetical protein
MGTSSGLGRNARRKNTTSNITYQRPLSISPWAVQAGVENADNSTVWISMKPRRIVDQFSKGAGTIATEKVNSEFKFLAPLSLNENVVHHWEQYESVASRLAQKVRSAVKLGAEGAALMGIFNKRGDIADTFKNTFSQKGGNVGTAIENAVVKTYNQVGGSRIPNIKIDTPLYYANSDRRQIVFEFLLFHENINPDNPEKVLIEPVQELMKYSSPDLQSDIKIEFPYMWEIRTLPYEFIKYTTCALIGVQPTWNAPYIGKKGLPSSVNLQLTFLDMSPLYAGTIENGSVINIISKSKADKMKNTSTFTVNPNPNANSNGVNMQRVFKGK